MMLAQGIFLSGHENEWVVEQRLTLNRHSVAVLRRGAEAHGDSAQAMRYLLKAADLAQTSELYEELATLSQRIGRNDLARAAQEAVNELAHGGHVQLTPRFLN